MEIKVATINVRRLPMRVASQVIKTIMQKVAIALSQPS